MATLTDRPQGQEQRWTPGRRSHERPPQPPGDRKPKRGNPRLLGAAYLLAPLTAAAAALLALAAVVVAIVLALGAGPAPPAVGAAAVVPANALLYLHVSTDRSRPEVGLALRDARRLPTAPALFSSLTARLDSILGDGAAVDFRTQVRPWLGREAAFAVLDTAGSSAGTLIVLDVRDRRRAGTFLRHAGAVPDGSYRHVSLLRQPSGTVFAFLGHYLVAGQPASVSAAVDITAGGAPSLAASGLYQRAADGEPDDRVLDAYVSSAGLQRALLPRQGLLGALGELLYQPPFSAATLTLSPTPRGFSLRVHTALFAPAVIRPARQFSPSLAAVLPARSTLVLDAASLRAAAAKLLAAAAKVGVMGRIGTLLARLGSALSAEGVKLGRLFGVFGGETAFALVPGTNGGGPAPVLVGRTTRPAAARAELGSIEAPLMQAFAPPSNGAGVAPEPAAKTVAGATLSELTLAPGLQFDWAVAHGLVVVSTTPAGIAEVLRHAAALDGEPAYRAALGDSPGQVTSLLFFDLGPLLRLGSRLGLIGGTALTALAPDIEQIRAIGLASTSGATDTTTQLQLQLR